MAKKTHLVLIDDIDGSAAAETIRFALDGVEYEVDLNEAHAEALRDSFAEWTGSARRVSASKNTSRRRSSSSSSSGWVPDTAKIREWAEKNGFTVASRGRIPANVREAYQLAH